MSITNVLTLLFIFVVVCRPFLFQNPFKHYQSVKRFGPTNPDLGPNRMQRSFADDSMKELNGTIFTCYHDISLGLIKININVQRKNCQYFLTHTF